MFCTNCGTEISGEINFCPSCGFKQGQKNNESMGEVKQNTQEENIEFPKDLLKCKELKVSGGKIEFTDESGKNVVTVVKTGGGVLKSASFEYLAIKSDGSPYVFMTSKVSEGDDGFTQTAFTTDGQTIGKASYNGGLKSMAKTLIRIVDKNGQDYKLEEEVGVVKGLFKIIAPPDHGIGNFASARTGDLMIKKGDMKIGLINSTRGSVHNTYRILDCNTLRERMDIRLIILGMTVKTHHIK